MNVGHQDRLLRGALLANASFSVLCTLVCFIDGPALATQMGPFEPIWLYGVGASLLPFALGLVLLARAPEVSIRWASRVCLADAGWVLGSVLLMTLGASWFGPTGLAVIGGVAVAVAGVCGAQLAGIRRLVVNPGPGLRTVAVFERDVDIEPARAWEVVSDVHDYAKYAPTLDFSRLVSGKGKGAIRECGDPKGCWTERCTAWDEGRSYAFSVDTQAEDYPYPFEKLQGEWRVDPRPGGSRIRMRFEVQMPGGWWGDLALALMLPRFQDGAETILDNWIAVMRKNEHAALRAA